MFGFHKEVDVNSRSFMRLKIRTLEVVFMVKDW